MKCSKFGRRIAAVVLSLAMAATFLPTAALAEETETGDESAKTVVVDQDTSVEGEYLTIQAAIDFIGQQEDKVGWTIQVATGTYDRFTVLDGMNNLTVQAADDADVTIKTCNGSNAPATTSGTYPDTAGVSIRYASGVTLKGLTFTVGSQSSPWYSAAVSNFTESGDKGNNVIVENCTFYGEKSENGGFADIGVFINTGTTKFTVKNCSFSGLKEAISMYGDGTLMGSAEVSGNTFEACSFAIHGYYGGNGEAGTLAFTNNTVTGTSDTYCKIVIQDQDDTGAIKVDIKGNKLQNAIVGLVNLREDGETVSEVLTSNTFDANSFYVEAVEPGTIDFYTSYQAPENSFGSWKLTGKEGLDVEDWGQNPDGSTATVTGLIETANASHSHTLNITGINADNLIKTFTWFKDGIYWETIPSGTLTISKTVVSDATSAAKEFAFNVTLNDSAFSGTYGDLTFENGVANFTLHDSESKSTVLPAGMEYKVTESETAGYTSEATNDEGTIVAEEEVTAAFVNTQEPVVPVEPDDPAAEDWEVSKSKTATNLDENFESKVTLSLPSAEEQLVSDVVFVLDKSTSADLENQALEMLSELKSQIEETNAKVNVGVVIFNQVANVTGFMDLATEYDSIKEAIEQKISSGTNSHAGLLAGEAMLDADTSVDASRKYLIFVSDGITYIFDDGKGNATSIMTTAYEANAGKVVTKTTDTMDALAMKYPYNTDFITEAGGMDAYLAKVANWMTADGKTYWGAYGGTSYTNTLKTNRNGSALILDNNTFGQYVGNNSVDDHANNIDTAIYLTVQAYKKVAEKYQCYALAADTGSQENYPWAATLMNYLAGNKSVTFDEIQNDIYYLVDEGSRVEDYIGYAENDYDFDFVNDASALSLKVGDTVYSAEKTAENTYRFADGDYIVTYVEGNKQDTEHFVWYIKVPVSNFAPVQLTYTVKLTNPKTADGTYGTYDADGSQKLDGLYTNLMAILYPIDTNGEQRMPEYFAKPTVSYTISNAKPVVPTPAPTPKDEHPEIAQAIKDGTWGKADPTPTPTVKPTSATVPQTGDNSNPVLWVVVMVMALAAFAGVVILRRRSNKD